MTVLKVLLPIGVILTVVVGGLSLIKSQVPPPALHAELQVGKVLPDFELIPLEGKPVLASQLPSKVMLVNFWATWCEACMVEMPSIIKLREAYKAKGFEVAAVNMDENPEAVVPKTVRKLGMPFTIYTDKEQKLAELFNIEAIPLTVVIDKDRKILMIVHGEHDWNGAEIRASLEKWLSG